MDISRLDDAAVDSLGRLPCGVAVRCAPGRRMVQSGVDQTITAAGLGRLLARLAPEAEDAAIEYERLRRALVRFFDCRGASPPEECADITIDRIARRLGDTDIADVHSYARGVARMVLLERRRQIPPSPLDHVPSLILSSTPPPESDDDQLRTCFERCLQTFPDDGRQLMVGYYDGERSAKIANRRRLAALFGISEGALRNRVHRLRSRLEQCVDGCVKSAGIEDAT